MTVRTREAQPEHVRQWWRRGNPLDVEREFKVGGRWRFVEHSDGQQHGMLASGMETGADQSYAALDEYLLKLV